MQYRFKTVCCKYAMYIMNPPKLFLFSFTNIRRVERRKTEELNVIRNRSVISSLFNYKHIPSGRSRNRITVIPVYRDFLSWGQGKSDARMSCHRKRLTVHIHTKPVNNSHSYQRAFLRLFFSLEYNVQMYLRRHMTCAALV